MQRNDGPWAHPPATPPRRPLWRILPPAILSLAALALAVAIALDPTAF